MKTVMAIAAAKLCESGMTIEDVKREMIEKVDADRLTKLCAIGAQNNFRKIQNNEINIAPLLNAWAESKWPIYMLLGRNLELTTHIPAIHSRSKLAQTFREKIVRKYPQYRLAFCALNESETCVNHVAYTVPVPKMLASYDRVTRLFAKLYDDKHLNADLASFYDDLTIHKDTIHISIDPYDYLTISLNKHNWSSCHNIEYGGYYSGNFAYMCDEATIVSFRDDGLPYDYDVKSIRFSGNSKQWRMLMFLDMSTASTLFTRQYPSPNDQSYNAVCELWKHTIEEFYDEPIKLLLRKKSACGADYCHETKHGYPDSKYNDYNVLAPEYAHPEFHVSKDYPCVRCGSIHKNAHALCLHCQQELRREVAA